MTLLRPSTVHRGRWLGVLALAIITWSPGCGPPAMDVDPPDGDPVSFSGRIQPIFTTACAGCHSEGGLADLSGIVLRLTADVSFSLSVGQQSVQRPDLTLVVPGDPASSLLFLKISSDTPPVGERMPRSAPPLSPLEIDLIRDWIDQGALNN